MRMAQVRFEEFLCISFISKFTQMMFLDQTFRRVISKNEIQMERCCAIGMGMR